jgi:hypothetical protein
MWLSVIIGATEATFMRRLWAMSVVAMVVMPVAGQTPATTADLAFMAGCWKLERDGRTVEEHWLSPSGGMLIGVGRTVAGGKTVEYEFLQIRDLPEGLTYTAKPSGQREASFKLASKTPDEVVFENPAHDFPQRIRYRRGADTLHARVEGTMNGKARGIDYAYSRVPCMP